MPIVGTTIEIGAREQLPLGRGTRLTVVELSSSRERDPANGTYEKLHITARVELRATVSLSRGGGTFVKCGVCRAAMPDPDPDALWFILAYHAGERLVFPREEGATPERDAYPCVGWRKIDDIMHCPACAEAVASAVAAVRATRGKGGRP